MEDILHVEDLYGKHKTIKVLQFKYVQVYPNMKLLI